MHADTLCTEASHNSETHIETFLKNLFNFDNIFEHLAKKFDIKNCKNLGAMHSVSACIDSENPRF